MNKREFAEAIGRKHFISAKLAGEIVESVFAAVRAELAASAGNPVRIYGFGTFFVKEMKPRRCLSVVDGAAIEIPKRLRVVFKPSAAFLPEVLHAPERNEQKEEKEQKTPEIPEIPESPKKNASRKDAEPSREARGSGSRQVGS